MLAGEFVTAIMPFSGDGDGELLPLGGLFGSGIMAPVPEVTQDVEIFRSALARGYVESVHAVL